MRAVNVKIHHFLFRVVLSALAQWGAVRHDQTFMYLGNWLMDGMWRWCAVNGHSLGGAMAQIMAVEMVVEAKSRPVLLAVLGSPVAGSTEFTTILREIILPTP